MRLFYFTLPFFLSSFMVAQNWTWIKGDSIKNVNGVYGTLGASTPSNNPGTRYLSAHWKDNNGKFWCFGGFGYAAACSGILNDLWKYDPLSNEWVWMKGDNTCGQNGNYGSVGLSAVSNKPGARTNAAYCTDASGKLWMFGGFGFPAAGGSCYLNDLWKYDPTNNQWTWMKGDFTGNQNGVYGVQGTSSLTNKPGSREYGFLWNDGAGNLWLFGGFGYDGNSGFNLLNDLWKYNIASNEWTWMKGSNIVNQMAVYGTAGTPVSTNRPGARQAHSGWTDSNGKLWLFGGEGNATNANGGLNDLWKYDPANNMWTFIKGDTLINKDGVYGTLGSPDPGNKPGYRSDHRCATDMQGNLWLFGGLGGATQNFNGQLNDLWLYDINAGTWTWMSGDSLVDKNGIYGTPGIQAPSNKPGARQGDAMWIDSNNDLWIFSGQGHPATGSNGALNDLWRFSPAIPAKIKNTSNGEIEVVLYPNPSHSSIRISHATGAGISITNLNGETILTKQLRSDEEEVSLENMSPGNYLVNIETENKRKSFRLIKN